MPRGGPPTYTYSLPPIYLAVPGTTILAAQHNTPLEDIAATLNDVWPVNLGGTGGTSPTSAWDAINSRGSNIATASTIDLDTATGPNVHLTGTTTVTTISLGNGRMRTAVADAAFDFTASASLIVNGFTSGTRSVPPGAMITFLGSTLGVVYVSFSTAYNTFEVLSTDAGATAGPILDLYRNSASPAASDTIGQIAFNGKDSAGNKQEYASIQGAIVDQTSTSESGRLEIYSTISGTRTLIAYFDDAFRVPVAAYFEGGDSAFNIGTFSDTGATDGKKTLGTSILGSSRDATTTQNHFQLYNPNGLIGSIGTIGSDTFISTPAGSLSLSQGQLQFPATQNPSSNANTLDDYEEGTFTLTAAFETPGSSSWAYTERTGYYTKIGNAVAVSFTFRATPTIGSGSGALNISGFPFTAISGPIQALTVMNMAATWTWPANRTYVAASMSSGSTLTLRAMGSGVSANTFGTSHMSSGSSHSIDASGIILVQ